MTYRSAAMNEFAARPIFIHKSVHIFHDLYLHEARKKLCRESSFTTEGTRLRLELSRPVTEARDYAPVIIQEK